MPDERALHRRFRRHSRQWLPCSARWQCRQPTGGIIMQARKQPDRCALTVRDRFHPLSIGAHWLTVLLLVAVYVLIELHGAFPKGSGARELTKHWHEMLGLAVFAIVFVRLALRAIYPAPTIQPPPPRWQEQAARAMHILLYVFLIIMPLLGWLV